MDINEQLFESVKNYMSNPNESDVLLKICMGTATDEEKKSWIEKTELPGEIADKLKQCCDLGYNFASQIDGKDVGLRVEKLETLCLSLNERIEKLETIIKEKNL